MGSCSAPSSVHLFILFLFRFRPITIGSQPRAMRTQISDPDCPFWKTFLVPCSMTRGKIIFFFQLLRPNLPVSPTDPQHVSAGTESSVCLAFSVVVGILPHYAHRVQHVSSSVFLLHIALEVPLAVQGVWSPTTLPFLQLNNTTLVILKVSNNSPDVTDAP